MSPRVSSLPGGALVAAERDRLNGTCSLSSFCKFDPGDERQRSSPRQPEMFMWGEQCPKIPRQQFLRKRFRWTVKFDLDGTPGHLISKAAVIRGI